MNYEEMYFKFIEKWKCQHIEDGVYTEKHHILPRHCGGGDEETNLVSLTYRQHTFAHRLLWKAYSKPQDLMAWKMMSGIDSDKKFQYCQMAGTIGGAKNRDTGHMSRVGKKYGPITGACNRDSGHLDRIRPLANNDLQKAKARKTGLRNVENGCLDRAREVALKNLRENGPSEKRKAALDKHNAKMKDCPKAKENMRKAAKIALAKKQQKAEQRAADVIKNAVRDESQLDVKPRGKYWYVSPEGLKFGTAAAAARYYGSIKNTDVQNWCSREHYGWHRTLVIR